MKKTETKPQPVPVNVVCSLCGEPWSLHRELDGEVTTLECIRLLRAKQPTTIYPTIIYRDRYPYWPNYQPYWGNVSGSGSAGSLTTVQCSTVNAAETPKVLTASAS